jgi:hypothetical protein
MGEPFIAKRCPVCQRYLNDCTECSPAQVAEAEARLLACGGHEKVYSNSVIMTNPPIHRWICAICGAKGEDRGVAVLAPSYEEIERRFRLQAGSQRKEGAQP